MVANSDCMINHHRKTFGWVLGRFAIDKITDFVYDNVGFPYVGMCNLPQCTAMSQVKIPTNPKR